MTNPSGSFIWYELLTTDPVAAERFYTEVIGWTASNFDGDTSGYRIFSADTVGVAGLMALPSGAADMRPGWFGYIGVDDVDAAVSGIVAAGGAVHMPATDLAGIGRIAMVSDPQGVRFYVMRGASEQSSAAFDADPEAFGRCGWNELATTDLVAATDFYTRHFGWTQGDVMNMGAMGDYRFIDHAGITIGAMMGTPPGGPPPAWTFYFRVADVGAAMQRLTSTGGAVVHGPAEVPGGIHIVIATDPQGASFAVVGKLG